MVTPTKAQQDIRDYEGLALLVTTCSNRARDRLATYLSPAVLRDRLPGAISLAPRPRHRRACASPHWPCPTSRSRLVHPPCAHGVPMGHAEQ